MMKCEGISHKCGYTDCYELNEDELVINVHANKEVDKVVIYYEDPYLHGCAAGSPWAGIPVNMKISKELKYENIWSITLKPTFKRIMYYFVVHSGQEQMTLYENGLSDRKDYYPHLFKYGWMNSSDICKVPEWVKSTIWYQIFPDRFCKSEHSNIKGALDWDDTKSLDIHSIYGGDIEGAYTKLEHLANLCITGVYFNPIFEATTNHKYNTTDYYKIDPDFGDDEILQKFITKAHKLGIKVMFDAVFNHSGRKFFAWQDVLKNGKDSKYFDWFFINDATKLDLKKSTKDGRYYTFAFVDEMPKLDTNNPEVIKYFCDVTENWLSRWDIDGIRFDVGNEISHNFIKILRRHLKNIKPDLFLLGEIWMDSSTYLQGDEYDSVMNYPFLQGVGNFFLNDETNAQDFKYMINYCYSIYKKQVNKVIFNLLDSHDIDRLITRSKSYDKFIQQLAVLFTMPGSPCIYYGTEIALEGANDPYNRMPMPWERINGQKEQETMELVKALISLRKNNPSLLGDNIIWNQTQGRVVSYTRNGDGDKTMVTIIINAGNEDHNVAEDGSECLFSYKCDNSNLHSGGVIVLKK